MWQMWQMPNIWHICHTKHKKIPPIRYGICAKIIPFLSVSLQKLYHFCLYRCKFATVRTEMVNRNIIFNSAFSLLSLLVFIFSLLLTSNPAPSHIRPTSDPAPPSTKKEQNVENGFGSWWRLVLGMGHGGDRFWVWVTMEIGFGYGSRWRSVLGMGHSRDCVWGSRWRLCLRSVLGFSCLSLFSRLGFSSGGSWCFSGGAVAWIGWGLGWIGCGWWVFWLGLYWWWDWLVFMGILAQATWERPLQSSPLRSLSFLVVVCFNFWCRGWYWL